MEPGVEITELEEGLDKLKSPNYQFRREEKVGLEEWHGAIQISGNLDPENLENVISMILKIPCVSKLIRLD